MEWSTSTQLSRICKLCETLRTNTAAAAKSLQSCPTLCDPVDSSSPGSPVPGILQARTLEWVAISFSNAWKWKVKVKSLSRVRLLETPWAAAHQAPLSVRFSRQEYWSGVPLPSPHADTLIPEWYTLSRTLSDHHIRASQGPFLLMSKPYLPLNSAPWGQGFLHPA